MSDGSRRYSIIVSIILNINKRMSPSGIEDFTDGGLLINKKSKLQTYND